MYNITTEKNRTWVQILLAIIIIYYLFLLSNDN